MKSIETIDNKKFMMIRLDFKNVTSENKFFDLMNESFDLPNYFRSTFSSLDDCMRDLGWFFNVNIKIEIINLNYLIEKNKELAESIQETLSFYKEYWDKQNLKKSNSVLFEFIS